MGWGCGRRRTRWPRGTENSSARKSARRATRRRTTIWKHSGHGHAYKTLADLDPPRNFDPECVSCHVVGWHPSKFFPYQGGFESLETTPQLANTGCEDCHGPGEKHCAAEMGDNEALQLKYRKAVVITKEQSKKEQCMTCHDIDNSPDFDFDKYWPLIEHKEEK